MIREWNIIDFSYFKKKKDQPNFFSYACPKLNIGLAVLLYEMLGKLLYYASSN